MKHPDHQTPTFPEILQSLCDETLQRRQETRYPQSLSIIVQPLDDDFRPDGEPFWVMSRDISRSGLGYVDVKPITHRYVRLRLLDHDAVAIGRVCHCTAISTDFPVYLSGVELLEGDDSLFADEA